MKIKQEDLIQEAKGFFDAYKKEIGESVRREENIIGLNFMSLSEFSPNLSDSILEQPEETIALMEVALEELGVVKKPRIRLLELPKSCYIAVREIRAKHLDKLLWIEGIVRQANEVIPRMVNAKFECLNCGVILSVWQMEKKLVKPSECACNWKGNFKLINKDMVDVQKLIIEEHFDSLKRGGELRKIDVFLQEDLVDSQMEKPITPGNKVKIYGVLHDVPIQLQDGGISTRFDHMIEVNNIVSMEENFENLKISEEDEKQINELAADPYLFKRLTASIAPSIYGYDKIKNAVLLQLFGGVRKNKFDGGMTRGDIHVLLVGDPGVAKSELLNKALGFSSTARFISGNLLNKTEDLTATITKDLSFGGQGLQAGHMVLANNGILCIDEIEKMNDKGVGEKLGEVMETQTVCISKCFQKDLEAKVSVLAAAYPKNHKFDPYTPIPQQIDISPALLSKFDVVFVLRDLPNKSDDRAIATHILEEHKQEIVRDFIPPELLKKYIAYAKQRVKPKLGKETIEHIKKFYTERRGQHSQEINQPPITTRQLGGIIRLSEAHARMRLSEEVEVQDAKVAIELLEYSLMQTVYDAETETFDIGRATTGVTVSKRGKILIVRRALSRLELKLGKLIPEEELKKAVAGKMTEEELKESINQLTRSGAVFRPKKGFIQRL